MYPQDGDGRAAAIPEIGMPEIKIVTEVAGRICAGIGALILAAGRFGTDRFVRRCEALLTGGW